MGEFKGNKNHLEMVLEAIKRGETKDLNRELFEELKLKLQGANLSGANLSGANLEGANLEGANLQNARLHDVYLREVNLSGADLRGAQLQGVKGLRTVKYKDIVFDRNTKLPENSLEWDRQLPEWAKQLKAAAEMEGAECAKWIVSEEAGKAVAGTIDDGEFNELGAVKKPEEASALAKVIAKRSINYRSR